MRLTLLRFLAAAAIIFLFALPSSSQCVPTNLNGTNINLGCYQTCPNLVFQIPHIKTTSSYSVINVPYAPYPYVTASGSEDHDLYLDDNYSNIINLPFGFCFYDSIFTRMVVGSNGLLTFDLANANCSNAWPITQQIPYSGGLICNASITYYPRSSIMGAFSDLDPRLSASPSDRKIQWDVFGTAPCRKFVISYYHIGVFDSGSNSCSQATPNTFQIVLHESTGIVEVFFEQKACLTSTNEGRAILGVQNWNRNGAVAAPGKNNTIWNETNTGYQFIPSGPGSSFLSSQIFDMAGTLLGTADTSTVTPGLLNLSFLNICPPAGHTQYRIVTMFRGCADPSDILISTDTISINRTNSLNATATSVNTTCGPPSGSVTVTVPAGVGTPPYNYSIDGGPIQVSASNTYTFNNLAQGFHNVVVTDATAGCSSLIRINVGLTSNLAAILSPLATSCPGVNNGTVSVTPTNGSGPYTFTLNPGAAVLTGNTATFTGLAPGTYTVSVTDATGCTTNPALTTTVGSGTSLTATTSQTTTSCAGVNDGSVTVTPTNGNPNYTFVLDGVRTQTGANTTFTGLSAGSHTIAITDANGCTLTPALTVNISSGAGITATTSMLGTSCAGASNGSITVTPNNGTAPFTFVLDGTTTQTGATTTFTGLSSGNHTISVTDANGCTVSPALTVNVTQGSALTATATPTGTSCAGANNGSVTVTPTNGNAPYTFVLDGTTTQTGTTTTFTGLSAGAHTITITDANGCTTSPALNVNIIAGAGLTANLAQTGTTCAGASNGTITVTPSNGAGPYTFLLDGAVTQTGATSTTFSGLASGNHTITITDASGCITNPALSISVTTGATLTGLASATATSCTGAVNGTVTINPSNGTGPFTFVLSPGNVTQTGATATYNNLAAGTYSVVITDASNCNSNPIPITINAGPALTTTATHTDALCSGDANGSITVTQPAAGNAPYEYSIDAGTTWQASNTFANLAAATYTIRYRELNGCQGQLTETVGQPATLTATVAAVPVVCNGQSNGTITVTPTGGVAPYQYSIDGGTTWQAGNIFTVPIGSYTITIRDNNLCTTTQTATITQPAVLTANATTTDATCNGGNDGTITVTAAGGNGSYQYSVNGTTFQASNVLNVAPGTYTVTVKDNLNCTITIPNTVVGLINDLTFTPPTAPTICEGTSTQLQLISNATQYSWSPATDLSNVSIANPVASPSATTNYTVTITYGRCTADVPVTVNVNAAPIANAGVDGFICYGQTFQLQGSGGTTFRWTPSTFLDDPTVANPIATPDKTTTYSLSVSDANGCNSLIADNIVVDVTPPIKVTTFPADTVVQDGQQFQVLATSVGTDYLWSPSTGLSDPTIANPIVTAGAIGDVITYRVEASTQAGCRGEGFVRVRVFKGPDLYVPTGFTPNGDGKNDKFFPFPVGIKQLKSFKVFNRWGQLIYSTTRLNDGWDGRKGGIEQASGVYVWTVDGVTIDDKPITRQGTVVLIR